MIEAMSLWKGVCPWVKRTEGRLPPPTLRQQTSMSRSLWEEKSNKGERIIPLHSTTDLFHSHFPTVVPDVHLLPLPPHCVALNWISVPLPNAERTARCMDVLFTGSRCCGHSERVNSIRHIDLVIFPAAFNGDLQSKLPTLCFLKVCCLGW